MTSAESEKGGERQQHVLPCLRPPPLATPRRVRAQRATRTAESPPALWVSTPKDRRQRSFRGKEKSVETTFSSTRS